MVPYTFPSQTGHHSQSIILRVQVQHKLQCLVYAMKIKNRATGSFTLRNALISSGGTVPGPKGFLGAVMRQSLKSRLVRMQHSISKEHPLQQESAIFIIHAIAIATRRSSDTSQQGDQNGSSPSHNPLFRALVLLYSITVRLQFNPSAIGSTTHKYPIQHMHPRSSFPNSFKLPTFVS